MASAKKTKSGAWTISVYIGVDQNGKKKYKRFTDTDKRRCERTAAAFVDEHRKVLDKKTFEYALNRYILSRTPVLSPATIRGYRTIEKSLKRDFEGFCAMSVYDIDKQTMQTLVNEMIVDGVSPKTIANRTGLISSVLKDNEVTPPDVRLPERRKPNLHIPDTEAGKAARSGGGIEYSGSGRCFHAPGCGRSRRPPGGWRRSAGASRTRTGSMPVPPGRNPGRRGCTRRSSARHLRCRKGPPGRLCRGWTSLRGGGRRPFRVRPPSYKGR